MAWFDDDLETMSRLLSYSRVVVIQQTKTPSLMELVCDRVKSLSVPVPAFISSRTSLEKKMLLFGGAYVLWKSYDAGIISHAGQMFRSLVPGLRWLKAKLGYFKVINDNAGATYRTSLESRRAGSDETTMTFPKCQCRIVVQRDDQLVVIGCAVRFDNNMLVAPDHVLGGDGVESHYALGTQSRVSLAGKERVSLDTDLVAIQLTDREFSMIGITVCKIAPLVDNGVFAQVVGPESKGTVGLAKPDQTIFGRVIYYGTTLHGYSGAAYMSGMSVVGIHQMGGAVNGGYSASYVWCMIKLHYNLRFESSEDWLLGQYKAGRRMRWRNVGDPDDVQINVNGTYSIVKRSSMNKAFGKNWEDNEVIEDRRHHYNWRDRDDGPSGSGRGLESVPESGESPCLETPGASSEGLIAQATVVHGPQRLMEEYNKLSSKQRANFRRLIGSLPKPQNNIVGLANPPSTQ